jgi:hypothetical protein
MGFTQGELKAADQKWELVQKGNNDETHRLRIFKGWLVKYTKQGNVGEVVYIEDAKGEWKL